MRRAAHAGLTVKAVGSGHSFTDAACTGGILVSLDRLAAVEAVDTVRGRVTVAGRNPPRRTQPGARSGRAGSAQSGRHRPPDAGRGHRHRHPRHRPGPRQPVHQHRRHGDRRRAGRELVRCDEHERPDLLQVARVGVGALGIVTRMTLQCVPAFDLHAVETVEPLDDLLDGFEQHMAGHDHMEFFWIPGARRAHVKRNRRTDEPRRPQPRLAAARDKLLVRERRVRAGQPHRAALPVAGPDGGQDDQRSGQPSGTSWTPATGCSCLGAWCASTRWSTGCPSPPCPRPCAVSGPWSGAFRRR